MSEPQPLQCLNCGHSLTSDPQARYCPRCGQETSLHPPSFLEFVHEFITHYVALEGPLWRTVFSLLLKPGNLTLEYFHGRRKHYVLPLRLFLTASFIFFLVAKVLGHGPSGITVSHEVSPGTTAVPAAAPATKPNVAVVPNASSDVDANVSAGAPEWSEPAYFIACANPSATCGWLDRTVGKFLSKFLVADSLRVDWQARWLAMAPYAIFLMLPLFASLLKLLYWGRHRLYGEHFVFSLHLQSFWFLALLLAECLPQGGTWLLLAIVPTYSCAALRNVYGGGWGATTARAFLLALIYGLMLAIAAAALAAWVVMNT